VESGKKKKGSGGSPNAARGGGGGGRKKWGGEIRRLSVQNREKGMGRENVNLHPQSNVFPKRELKGRVKLFISFRKK